MGKESFTNVIRFEEIEYNADGSIAKDEKGKQKRFKTEWLSSVRVFKGNCFILAKLGRMRADHEDLHNSLKIEALPLNMTTHGQILMLG